MDIIRKHLKNINLDIRKSGDARFTDQKVTPDVLCIVADCVLQFTDNNLEIEFTTKDIWESDYANTHVKNIFNKPDVLDKKASSEYDKFFAQPLKMLAYSNVLILKKRGVKNFYTINNKDLLAFISIKERNTLNFITLYLEKVLQDSNIFYLFEDFFDNNTKNNFDTLKTKYEEFIIDHTNINTNVEVRRIFTKILNPLAHVRHICGVKKGRISKDVIGYDEIMYNRKNWRDTFKKRGETRSAYNLRLEKIDKSKNAWVKFTITKAKKLIKLRHKKTSEVYDESEKVEATQVHHIFPKSDYPTIETYPENLILLTANQHYLKAHPNNNTQIIDKEYQLLCLLSKSTSIKESVETLNDGFYSKDDFISVLNIGICPKIDFIITKSFSEIEIKITNEYHQH